MDKCCENCIHFDNEDSLGWGSCKSFEEAFGYKPFNCGYFCAGWEDKESSNRQVTVKEETE